MTELNIDSAIRELRLHLEGDVLSSYHERVSYATDESIFSLLPALVVAPKSVKDVQSLIEVANYYQLSISARGGGTGVAGQSIGSGIVVDFKKYFNQILDIASDHVRLQPGVVLKDLNAALLKQGRKFAPDPGSWRTCTVGGMAATNAAGPHCFKYGSTREHLLDMNVVLSSGVETKATNLAQQFPLLAENIKIHQGRIQSQMPLVRKNSSGYALQELCADPPRFERFLVGSEGTLCMTTELTLKTVPLPQKTILGVYGFQSLEETLAFVAELRATNPSAIELLDEFILKALNAAHPGILNNLQLSLARYSIWVEWEDDGLPITSRVGHLVHDTSERLNLWAIRSKASKYLHEQARDRQPLRCIEDTVVPVAELEPYMLALIEILKRHGCMGAIFGHIGDGHLHVNPQIDVTQPRLWSRIEYLMDEVYALVLKHGGSISGEHGDGMLRASYVKKQWHPVMDLMLTVKNRFDPKWIFNPGKKLSQNLVVHPPLKRMR